jgi:hypothetical protein
MTSKQFKFVVALLVGILSLAYSPGSATAAVITFELRDATRDTGWNARFDDAKVTNPSFAGIATGRNEGTFTVTKTFNDLNSIDITFLERADAPADAFGFRITMGETVRNRSGVDWKDFHLELIDPNVILVEDDPNGDIPGKNRFVSDDHPGFAHFHKDAGQTFPPFTPNPNPPDVGGLQGKMITLSGGTFANGQDREWKGIGIHQIEEKGEKRNFTLRQTPTILEPSTLALLGIGALAMLGYVWRRKRREERELFKPS